MSCQCMENVYIIQDKDGMHSKQWVRRILLSLEVCTRGAIIHMGPAAIRQIPLLYSSLINAQKSGLGLGVVKAQKAW